MKNKTKKTAKRKSPGCLKIVRDEGALKAVGRLEKIRKDLVPEDERQDIGPLNLLAKSAPGGIEGGPKNELKIIVHTIITDRREEVLKETDQGKNDEKE